MMALLAEARRDLPRWILSAGIVVLAHGGVAAAFVHWHTVDEDADPTSALVVNLAPMPVSPADTVLAPPGPEQVQGAASPQPAEKVEEKPEETREATKVEQEQPELLPAENPEVAMAALPPEARPEVPKTADNQVPAPVTTAPQAPPVEQAAIAAAPTQGQINISNSNAIPTWKRQVLSVLERNKRYPSAAQARGQHGIVQLSFSLDRQGRVVASHIAKSSGSSVLDEATLELVQRAQPFPAPPPEMAGARVNLSVPIRYNIR
jgi:protein TonB